MARQPQFALRSILVRHAEAQLNRWIAQSSAAQRECSALEGRSLCVEVVNTRSRIVLAVAGQRVSLSVGDEVVEADIVIRAALFDLLDLLRARSLAQLSGGAIEFRGSLGVADRFSNMLRLARPQLEDELAGWIGGLPAHALAQMTGRAVAWSSRTSHAVALDAVEYLQSESRVLPLPYEVGEFMRAVEQLRDDVERLEQRIERLAGVEKR